MGLTSQGTAEKLSYHDCRFDPKSCNSLLLKHPPSTILFYLTPPDLSSVATVFLAHEERSYHDAYTGLVSGVEDVAE